jgi:hypothetical protein
LQVWSQYTNFKIFLFSWSRLYGSQQDCNFSFGFWEVWSLEPASIMGMQ